MTTFYLVRHASYDRLGSVLAGWTPGVHLNLKGMLEARHLAERLSAFPIDIVFTSPLDRCRETAALIADRLGKPVYVDESFGEIQFGDWTGRTLAELEPLPEFQQFQRRRSLVRIPNGESMSEVQVRAALGLRLLNQAYPHGGVVVVSHVDVLKAMIADAIGLSLDEIGRFHVDPASITTIERTPWETRLVKLNDAGGLPVASRAVPATSPSRDVLA